MLGDGWPEVFGDSSPIGGWSRRKEWEKTPVCLGVGQSCTLTWRLVIAVRLEFVPSRSPIRFFIAKCASGVLLSSIAVGVGQSFACPAKSVPHMGAAEAVKFGDGTILKIPGGGGQYKGDDADQVLENVK